MKFSNGISAIVLICATAVASTSAIGSSGNDEPNRLQHRNLVRKVRSAASSSQALQSRDNEQEEPHYVNLQKRYGGQATFYNNQVSEGACGGYSSNSDFIVAMNVAQYGNPNSVSSWCGKQIRISYGGESQVATVVDCCPSCGYGSLDMSPGLFSSFTNLGQGVFQMSWEPVGSGGGGSGSGSGNNNNHNNNNNNDDGSSGSDSGSNDGNNNKKQSTPSPKPTTHSAAPTTTSTKPTSTSTTSHSTSSTISSTSSTASSSSTPVSNLANLNEVYNGLYNLANAAGGAH